MPAKKKITDPLLHARHLGFQRARCQARFRREPWTLTEQQWNDIWTPERWQRRGRHIDDLCLCLIDEFGGWSVDNVVMLSRDAQLKIKNLRFHSRPYEHLYAAAEWAPQ
jgi:hypothetical protein